MPLYPFQGPILKVRVTTLRYPKCNRGVGIVTNSILLGSLYILYYNNPQNLSSNYSGPYIRALAGAPLDAHKANARKMARRHHFGGGNVN